MRPSFVGPRELKLAMAFDCVAAPTVRMFFPLASQLTEPPVVVSLAAWFGCRDVSQYGSPQGSVPVRHGVTQSVPEPLGETQ